MKKAISLMLIVGLLGSPAMVRADDEQQHPPHGSRDGVAAIALTGWWATGAAVATGSLKASFAEYTAMGVFVFGMLAGTYLSWKTDPQRQGRGFRYNHQDDATGEERKFENDPTNPGWKRLKGYPLSGPAMVRPLSDAEVHQAWVRQFEVKIGDRIGS